MNNRVSNFKVKNVEPDYVCAPCAEEAGGKWPENHVSTSHENNCEVCGEKASLCHVRNWGRPKFYKEKDDNDR